MAEMALMAAVMMTFGVSTGFAMDSAEPGLNRVIQLNMAPDSVDDMYHGCKDKMNSKVLNEFLENEKNGDDNFKKAWEMAGKKPFRKDWKERAMAIHAYTLDDPNVDVDFNNAVQTQRSQYKTTFKYHALHFFLTDALQTLNARKPDAERCLTGYHRNKDSFSQDVLNKEIRFGFFTSTSQGGYLHSKYGDKSCFEIYTCTGADISTFSKFEGEREVLIPPYEVFKVTKIKKRSEQKDLPCEVEYTVKSTGKTLSNTNCAFFQEAGSQI